jgi:peroxiredoxin Q/BCP
MSPTLTTKLQPGTPAPDFTLQDAQGRETALADYRGKNVIVYFYPKAATPGCTTEACDFRDSLASLQGKGYEVIGVSPDEPKALAGCLGREAG